MYVAQGKFLPEEYNYLVKAVLHYFLLDISVASGFQNAQISLPRAHFRLVLFGHHSCYLGNVPQVMRGPGSQ